MTRSLVAAAIFAYFVFLSPQLAIAQAHQESRCFPWQEYRDGRCVPKPVQAPPPVTLPAPADIGACNDGNRSLSTHCACPEGTHPDASAHCVADSAPVLPAPSAIVSPSPQPRAEGNIVCDGGTVTNNECHCPAGFSVMPASGNAGGGICVKTKAENCLGGELTVSGTCLCNGQDVMSGETYLLEYSRGKCVPKRCPVQTQWRGGKCVAL